MATSNISIIVAIADGGAIGRNGDQPFYIKEDLRRFKQLTTGHPIIMGRRTFEALPRGPLPNRVNIVVTRNRESVLAAYPGHPLLRVASSLKEAFSIGMHPDTEGSEEVFVIGGGEVYRQAFPMANKLYVTRIEAAVEDADTFFPEIDPREWVLEEEQPTATDAVSGVGYRFLVYRRR